jgi:hypothetical protein
MERNLGPCGRNPGPHRSLQAFREGDKVAGEPLRLFDRDQMTGVEIDDLANLGDARLELGDIGVNPEYPVIPRALGAPGASYSKYRLSPGAISSLVMLLSPTRSGLRAGTQRPG